MRATAREPERVRREQDEAGAAAAKSDERARILRLQASAGNQAVAKLLRVGTAGAKRLKKEPGGVTLTQMQAFQKAGGLSDKDVDAMLRLGDDDLAEAVKLDAKLFKGSEDEADMSARMRYARSASTKPKTAAVKQSNPREDLILDVQGKGVLEPDARTFVNGEGVGEVKDWIAGRSNKTVSAAVRLCVSGDASLATIDDLVTYDADRQNYGADVVIPLAAERTIDVVKVALQETRAAHSFNYVETWLSLGATASSQQTFKDLVRLIGCIKDGTPGMAVYQADTQYMGAHDYPHSRTGFLRYAFAGGGFVELHTHWNVNVRKIVSIHVKEGADKSTELNSWAPAFFGVVNAAVLAAHNAAPGALAPTGGSLTL